MLVFRIMDAPRRRAADAKGRWRGCGGRLRWRVMLAALAALLAGCSAIVVEDGARVQVGEREYSQKIS